MGVQQLDLQVSQLAQGFRTEGEAALVGAQVQRLLDGPVASARGLVRGLPTAEVNAAGASFCAPFRALDAKYPFNDRALQQASVEEVSAALQKGSSQLWTFYEEHLQGLLVPQGTRYAPRVGADLRPTEPFVAFFNRAAGLSDALFPEGATVPTVSFALGVETSPALPAVRVTIDGTPHTFEPTNAGSRAYVWRADRARSVRFVSVIDGVERTLLENQDGTWALFTLLRDAQWEQTGAQEYRLRWQIPTPPGELTANIIFASRTPVFRADALRLDCVSQIVR